MEGDRGRPFIVVSGDSYVKTPDISLVRSAARRHVIREKMAVEVRQQHNHILQTRFPAEKIIPATHQSNPNKPPRVAQLIKFNLSGETTITTTPTSKKGKGKGKAEQRLIPREGVKSPVTMPWQPYSRILDESQSAVLAFADQFVDMWKWEQSKEDLIRDAMSDQGLRHSFLAIAYNLWKRDMVRAVVHENATIKYLEDQFALIGKFSSHERADHVRKLARSVTRLAIIKVNHGDVNAATVHIKGLSVLLSMSGGFGELSPSNHLRGSVGSLILPYLMLWKSVPDRLQHPLGPMTNSAFADVKTLGFSVSENCLLFEKTLSLIPLRIIDVLRSLNALCTAAQTRIDKIGQPARGLAYESLKLALRLGYLGQEQNVYSNEQAIEEYFGECLRLATLLFIWAFTRKVPLTSPTMKTCHKQIRTLIASERFDELIRKTELNGAHMEVILWMLLVLGSTAHSIQDRAFYADSIRRFIPQALMYSFAEIQEKCTQIVWLFRTCDTPAGTFWTMCSFGI